MNLKDSWKCIAKRREIVFGLFTVSRFPDSSPFAATPSLPPSAPSPPITPSQRPPAEFGKVRSRWVRARTRVKAVRLSRGPRSTTKTPRHRRSVRTTFISVFKSTLYCQNISLPSSLSTKLSQLNWGQRHTVFHLFVLSLIHI